MVAGYPISAASRITSISLDTLRAWERRYKAVVPRRSGRSRVYNDHQIKRLLLLRKLLDRGYSIGQVAGVDDKGLQSLLRKSQVLSPAVSLPESAIYTPVLEAIGRYDYADADRELNRLAAAIASPRELVHQVALPLMREVGVLWHEGTWSIAQEHMVSALLSGLLSSFVRAYSPGKPAAKVLLATPRNERHGFANLAAALLAVAGGLGIVPLGTDLPAKEILTLAQKTNADAVLLSLSSAPGDEAIEDLQEIGRRLPPNIQLWLGCNEQVLPDHSVLGRGWRVLRDFASLETEMGALGARF